MASVPGRVFFNIRLDGGCLPDRAGQHVRDLAEARRIAHTIVRQLVQRHGGDARLLDARLSITDEAGGCVLDLSFFEALYLPVEPAERASPGPSRPRRTRRLLGLLHPDRLDGARAWIEPRARAGLTACADRSRALLARFGEAPRRDG